MVVVGLGVGTMSPSSVGLGVGATSSPSDSTMISVFPKLGNGIGRGLQGSMNEPTHRGWPSEGHGMRAVSWSWELS